MTITLPEKLYYSLPKALKEVNKELDENNFIDLEDLFHFAFIEELEICTFIDYSIDVDKDPFLIYFETNPDYTDELCDLLSKIKHSDSNVVTTNCGSFSVDGYSLCEDNVSVVIESRDVSLLFSVNNSYFSPVADYEKNIKNNLFYIPRTFEISKDSVLHNYSQHMFFLYSETEISEPYKNLYITKQELEIFKNGGKVLPITNRINKNPAPKTVNAQAKFIKALIIANYGDGIAKNVRWNIDTENTDKNEIGKIRQHFQTKGLGNILPDGKTVYNWIKNIELDSDWEFGIFHDVLEYSRN